MPEQFPEIRWIAPKDNPWNVRLLDLRPVTQGMISTSSDPQCAANALSFNHDDGSSFIAMNPNSTRTVPVDLRYRIAHPFPDGALFIPACMEEKWAIFYRSGQILFVRSWTRELYARAAVEIRGEEIQITAIQGDLIEENEPPGYKERIADYLIRSHALNLVHPVPLANAEEPPSITAMWCFKDLVVEPHLPRQTKFPTNSLNNFCKRSKYSSNRPVKYRCHSNFKWTRHKKITKQKVILPVWHKIDREFVAH